MRKLHCSDEMMAAACAEIAAGLTDADLGSNLYKKRIPIEGRGKSGGLRTIIASRFNGRWFILAIWVKSDLVNIPRSSRWDCTSGRISLSPVKSGGRQPH